MPSPVEAGCQQTMPSPAVPAATKECRQAQPVGSAAASTNAEWCHVPSAMLAREKCDYPAVLSGREGTTTWTLRATRGSAPRAPANCRQTMPSPVGAGCKQEQYKKQNTNEQTRQLTMKLGASEHQRKARRRPRVRRRRVQQPPTRGRKRRRKRRRQAPSLRLPRRRRRRARGRKSG